MAVNRTPHSLPQILELVATLQRYTEPRVFFLGAERLALREAVELVLRTDAPIPAQGISPAIYVGTVALPDFELVGHQRYRFFGIQPERLRRGAPISFGYPFVPAERRMRTRFRFQLGGPPLVS